MKWTEWVADAKRASDLRRPNAHRDKFTVTHYLKEVGVFTTEIKGRDRMDTRIWMQESFWESTEEQNVKESPQENAGHLSKGQNENGGNKLVDQKTSLWQQTYENILVGMGFCGITLNFFLLNYILPFIGILMIFAGLRKLRQKNEWFKMGYVAAAVKLVITMISLVVGTFISAETIYDTYNWKIMLLWAYALPLITAFSFFRGMRAELKKRDKEADSNILIHIFIWYMAVIFLAVTEYSGWIIGIIIVAAYIGILVELKHTAEDLEKAGYVLEEYPVHVSNGKCEAGAVVLTAAGLAIGTIFFGSYHMKWNEVKAAQNPECEEIKTHLISLGFPKDILDDLKEEDIIECRNARQVLLERNDYPINDGVDVSTTFEGYTQHSREYPKKELKLSGVAVELEREGQWKIIHHFLWNEDPGFRGTEALQLYPVYREWNGGWIGEGELTGQVLYDKKEISYAADYASLENETYDLGQSWPFYESRETSSIFAEFSMPRRAEHCRGYVAYGIKAKEDGWWIDSWLNYTHQKSMLQYPVMTAAQNRKQGGSLVKSVFVMVQDALQVLPGEETD